MHSRALAAAAGAIALSLGLAQAAPGQDLKRVDFRAAGQDVGNPGFATFFDHGGLALRGRCASQGSDLQIRIRSRVDDATIHMSSKSSGEDDDYAERDDFAAGRQHQIDPFASANDGGLGDGASPESAASNSGQFAYSRPGGENVTVEWASEADGALFGGEEACAFVGTARVAGPSSPDRVNYRANAGSPQKTFFELGGLTLTGGCNPQGDQTIIARSAFDDAIITGSFQAGADTDGFSQSSDFDIVDGFFISDDLYDDGAMGQLVYSRPGGVNVSVDWMAEEELGSSIGGAKDCLFSGAAHRSGPSNQARVEFRTVGFGGDFQSFFSSGGLELLGQCSSVDQDLDVRAASRSNHALIHFNGQGNAIGAAYGEADDFNTGAASQVGITQTLADHDVMGQIVYARDGGKNTTATWLAADGETASLYGGTADCAFVGTAEVAPH